MNGMRRAWRQPGPWLNAAALFVFWLLLVDHWQIWENLAGALSALIAAFATEWAREQRFIGFAPRPGWWLLLLRLPAYLARDMARLLLVLGGKLLRLRNDPGVICAAPFHAGGYDPRAAARSILAVLIGSYPPNSIVLEIDRDENRVVMHQLLAAGLSGA